MDHKKAVICHMIGQSMIGAERPVVTVTDVAKWMSTSRQWAHEILRQLMESGEVERVANPYRNNAVKHTYQLTEDAHRRYKIGHYKYHYTAWLQEQLPF